MFSKIIFIFSISSIFAAVDLNIYRSVTELRQKVHGIGSFEYVFSNGVFANIIDGSVSWDGTPLLRQEIYNTIESLKGVHVNVRLATACECQTIEARIVDPNGLLLENLETGTYFYADPRSIEYISVKPNNGGTTLTIEFSNSEDKYCGTLSYLMRGIAWVPSYDLFVNGDDACSIVAYANIRNNQQQEYDVNNTFLYSGDLQLVNTFSTKLAQPPMARTVLKSSVADNASGALIEFSGEERGFYFYSLKTNYKLRPSSTIRMPFVEINPICKFYYKTSTNIGTGQYKGVFQRNYDFQPDKFVPAGVFTIRDQKVLIGQSNVPDVPDNFTHTIVIGQDNDVRYNVNGNLIASNDEKAKVIWRTFELEVTISNFKSKPVRGQLDFFGAIQTKIDDTTCNGLKVNANSINLPFELNAGDNTACRFTVTLTWG